MISFSFFLSSFSSFFLLFFSFQWFSLCCEDKKRLCTIFSGYQIDIKNNGVSPDSTSQTCRCDLTEVKRGRRSTECSVRPKPARLWAALSGSEVTCERFGWPEDQSGNGGAARASPVKYKEPRRRLGRASPTLTRCRCEPASQPQQTHCWTTSNTPAPLPTSLPHMKDLGFLFHFSQTLLFDAMHWPTRAPTSTFEIPTLGLLRGSDAATAQSHATAVRLVRCEFTVNYWQPVALLSQSFYCQYNALVSKWMTVKLQLYTVASQFVMELYAVAMYCTSLQKNDS